jgi:hypothetical protein
MAHRLSLPEEKKIGIAASYELIYPLALGFFVVSKRAVGVVNETDLLAISVDHGLLFRHYARDRAGLTENTPDRSADARV